MLTETVSPIFRSTLTACTAFWSNAPTLLLTGDTIEMELFQFHLNCVTLTDYIILRWNCSSSISTVSPVGSRVSTLFQKAVYTVKVLLKMGETVARNMYTRLKRINKSIILLHLVVYGYHCTSDAWSQKRQV